MKSRWRQALLTIFLAAFFTLFLSGRSSHWAYVASDNQGRHYYLDERSLELLDAERTRFSLRCDSDRGVYVIDSSRRTILTEGEDEARQIPPDSVASTLLERVMTLRAQRESPSPPGRAGG
ncbi:MAG: hypothetical protein KC910_10020 [Candidatus Eremiobacteraeota bacterium]|nr:hypothetical protein [Candidatus Eremiobacteraeota bacterium]